MKNSFTSNEEIMIYLHNERFECFRRFEGVVEEIGLGSAMHRASNPTHHTLCVRRASSDLH